MTLKASISLDLDNKWSYLKIRGDTTWESYPTYFDQVIPLTLEMFREVGLRVTFFIVGKDAELATNLDSLRRITEQSHDVGNHSFKHEPWLHLYTKSELSDELQLAHASIFAATGMAPIGFRGPGFSLSCNTIQVLAEMGYTFDASTFPSFLGPLARAYYFRRSKKTARNGMGEEDVVARKELFGKFSDGLRPLKPYRIAGTGLGSGRATCVANCSAYDGLIEIPVTTMPVCRVPFHLSYFLYMASFSEICAKAFFWKALLACRLAGVGPSLLLHPLDFLGKDDEPDLGFFPAMNMSGKKKLSLVRWALGRYRDWFDVMSLNDYASYLNGQPLPVYPLLCELPE